MLQGGRAAEFLIYGHYSTGASDDLARATDILTRNRSVLEESAGKLLETETLDEAALRSSFDRLDQSPEEVARA